jgi:hypothetical protein
MTKSSRLTPNQFSVGLTTDATRLEHDLVALANRYNDPPPTDVARRWVENHMVAGFIPWSYAKELAPDANELLPQQPPWMGDYNSALTATVSLAEFKAAAPGPAQADIINPWRAKGTAQQGTAPQQDTQGSSASGSTMLSWEMSWTQSTPCLLDAIRLVLATDTFYNNSFLFGPNADSVGKIENAPIDSIVVQVLVDSALAEENRVASLAPVLLNQFPATQYWMTLPAYNNTLQNMQPPPCLTNSSLEYVVPNGLCIDVFPRQPIPENARVRLILSIPMYRAWFGASYAISDFGYNPSRSFVLTGHVTLLQPLEAE